jgi:hypothetical protein
MKNNSTLQISIITMILCLFSFSSFAAKFAWIETADGKKLSFYEKKKNYFLTEWDILVEPYQKQADKANSRRFGKWKKGIIPFEIDSSIPESTRIEEAIDYLHENTKIRFVPRTNEKDYVYFKNNGDQDCSSFVGKKGGKQNIHVSNWCGAGSLVHEILHALGFFHEQSRPDRSKFIKVHWSNIQLKNIHNFFLSPFAKTYGKFDMDSIMLYPSFNGFAKDPSKPTMSLRNGGTWDAQRKKMSQQDLEALDTFYASEFESRNKAKH